MMLTTYSDSDLATLKEHIGPNGLDMVRPVEDKMFRGLLGLYKEKPDTYFKITEQGAFIGNIDFKRDTSGLIAEIGFWIAQPFQRKGYATQAVNVMLAKAFNEYGLRRIWARTTSVNTASIRVLEKCRFIKEGELRNHRVRDGVFCNEVIYGLLIEDYPHNAEQEPDGDGLKPMP